MICLESYQLKKIVDNKIEKKRKTALKFSGVILDKNIYWEEYIRAVKTKLVKNIGPLYRAKPLLEEKSIIYIHS